MGAPAAGSRIQEISRGLGCKLAFFFEVLVRQHSFQKA